MLLGLIARIQVVGAGLRQRIAGESGAVATEYVLLLVFIAAAIIGAATVFGLSLDSKYQEVCGAINGGACP